MLTPREFYYLRHGETDWNRERRQQDRTDIPLNEIGVAQVSAALPLLAGLGKPRRPATGRSTQSL